MGISSNEERLGTMAWLIAGTSFPFEHFPVCTADRHGKALRLAFVSRLGLFLRGGVPSSSRLFTLLGPQSHFRGRFT